MEFDKLNYDFHPRAIRRWLKQLELPVERTLTVSHFRVGFLKRHLPTNLLVSADSVAQWTGALWQLSPSVFVRASKVRNPHGVETRPAFANPMQVFKCPDCGYYGLEDAGAYLLCLNCSKKWEVKDGIYDFRKSID